MICCVDGLRMSLTKVTVRANCKFEMTAIARIVLTLDPTANFLKCRFDTCLTSEDLNYLVQKEKTRKSKAVVELPQNQSKIYPIRQENIRIGRSIYFE